MRQWRTLRRPTATVATTAPTVGVCCTAAASSVREAMPGRRSGFLHAPLLHTTRPAALLLGVGAILLALLLLLTAATLLTTAASLAATTRCTSTSTAPLGNQGIQGQAEALGL
jgi:hypothetical protein